VGGLRSRGVLAAFVVPAIVASISLSPSAAAAAVTVNCAKADLQAAIDTAAPGSTLLVTGTCFGNSHLDKNLTLKGNPSATLDGGDAGTTLTITGSPTVHLLDLVITGGWLGTSGIGRGGGIQHEGGTLALDRVSVTGNVVSASGTGAQSGRAQGAGIYSDAGQVQVTDSSVTGNLALASGPGSDTEAAGGAIYSSGPVTLTGSTVSSNRVVATSSLDAAFAFGGGVAIVGKDLHVSASHIDDNRAIAHSGTNGTYSEGGGVFGSDGAAATIDGSTVSRNRATGSAATAVAFGGALNGVEPTIRDSTLAGNRTTATASSGSALAMGGAIHLFGQSLTLVRSRVTGSTLTATGSGGVDATAEGGNLDVNGPVIATSSTISFARVIASSSTGDVSASGGGISAGALSSLTLTRSTVQGNRVTASSAGPVARGGGVATDGPLTMTRSTASGNVVDALGLLGADARGGGIHFGSTGGHHSLLNSTVAGNVASASTDTGDVDAVGGGIDAADTSISLTLTMTTIARNSVQKDGTAGEVGGGGVAAQGGLVSLEQTILALNAAPAGPNCSGAVSSAGRNLLGPTAGCAFAAAQSDKVNVTSPKLGPLANNGGPTKTIALLSGSPAIDVIPGTSCEAPIDQRGVKRPQGTRCDIGAYERKA
jgi:hypothetical protein